MIKGFENWIGPIDWNNQWGYILRPIEMKNPNALLTKNFPRWEQYYSSCLSSHWWHKNGHSSSALTDVQVSLLYVRSTTLRKWSARKTADPWRPFLSSVSPHPAQSCLLRQKQSAEMCRNGQKCAEMGRNGQKWAEMGTNRVVACPARKTTDPWHLFLSHPIPLKVVFWDRNNQHGEKPCPT